MGDDWMDWARLDWNAELKLDIFGVDRKRFGSN